MITKFNCKTNQNYIEFQREKNNLLIVTRDMFNDLELLSVILNKDELFSLIGQLLRIQSEINKIES